MQLLLDLAVIAFCLPLHLVPVVEIMYLKVIDRLKGESTFLGLGPLAQLEMGRFRLSPCRWQLSRLPIPAAALTCRR